MKRRFLQPIATSALILFSFFLTFQASAQKHEWTYIHTDGGGKKAFLWIPNSAASGIRALFIIPHTSVDKNLATDSVLRAMAQKEQMAILYSRQDINCFNSAADTSKVINLLNNLSQLSGFAELNSVPWVTWGHSAGSFPAVAIGYWKPERTIAVLTHSGNLLRPNWTAKELPNVPFMAIKGQFEEWSVNTNNPTQCGTEYEYNWVIDTVISSRKLNVAPFLGSAMVRPGEGHMGINTEKTIPLIAMFIQKAIQKRVPKGRVAINGPITLNPIAENTGWLVEPVTALNYSTSLVDSFPNLANPKNFFWLPDREMALAWKLYQKDINKQTQNMNLRNNPPVASPSINFSFGISSTNNCGLNFSGPNVDMSKEYTFSNLVATSGLPIILLAQDGAAFMTSDVSVRINPCLFDLNNKTRLLMRQEGNETFQMKDRQIVLTVVKKNSGTSQTASIAPIAACKPGDTLSYSATLTSGLQPTVLLFSGPGKLLPGNKIAVLPFISKTGSTAIVLRAAHTGDATFASSNLAEIVIPVNSVLPNVPGAITGPGLVLPPATNQTYSVSPISNATSYVWTVPENAIIVSGQGSNSITVSYLVGFIGGTITVTGVNAIGDGAIAEKEVLNENAVGTALAMGSPLVVYPNPGTGVFQIQGIKPSSEISVFDLSGKRINTPSTAVDGRLDLQGRKGIFILQVRSKETVQRVKLLVLNP